MMIGVAVTMIPFPAGWTMSRQLFITVLAALCFTMVWPLAPGFGREKLVVDRSVLKLAENTGTVMQDQDGFLWFGTNGSGLFRYDGISLKAFKTGPGSISDNYVFALFEDSEGIIWIGTRNGLNAYNKLTGKITIFRHDPDNENSIGHDAFAWGGASIWESSTGEIWAGTMRGLNRYDKRKKEFTRYDHDPEDPRSLGHDIVYAGLEDRDGIIWVATLGGGLNRFNGKQGNFTRFVHDRNDAASLSDNSVMSLIEDRDGEIWVGTMAGGLNRFDKSSGSFERFVHDSDNPNSLSHNNVFSIFEDRSGLFWFGRYDVSPFGLETFDKKTRTFHVYHHDPDDPDSISSDLVFGVFEDRSGIIWIVNLMESIDKIDQNKPRFTVFRHKPNDRDSIGANPVVRVYEDRESNIWIGPFGKGVEKLDRRSGKWTHFPPAPDSPTGMARYVPGMLEDGSGLFWLGNFGGTLSLFDRERGEIVKTYSHDPDNPAGLVKHSQLNHIVQDRTHPNILWLAAYDGGLVKFDKTAETFVRYNLTANQMWMVYQDGEGIIWIPTLGGGLDRFDPAAETVTNYKHSRKDSSTVGSNSLNYVLEDANSNILWIGGSAGLDKFEKSSGKVVKRYSKSGGFDIEGVMTIVDDDRNNLWIGTDSGLVRFNIPSETVKTFKEEDGLPGNKFNFIGVAKGRDGTLWFGTYGGLLSFHPDDIKNNDYSPPVVLTSLKQGGEAVVLKAAPEKIREIVLDWDRNYFEFEYAALNYTQPAKCRFQYMLEGYDSEWFFAGTNRFGRYTNLPGGNYTLKIMGSNNDGVWNDIPLEIQVVVGAPFWESAGFLIAVTFGCVVFICFCGFYFLKLRFEIRDRKLAQKHLQESEKRYRSLLENQTELVFRSGPDGTLTFVNRVYCDFFGKRKEELIGKARKPQPAEGDAVRIEEELRRMSPSNQTVVAEYRVVSGKGKTHWMQFVNRAFFDPSGKITEIQSVGRDITERKKMESELEERNKFVDKIIDSSALSTWISDDKGTVIRANPACLEFFGAAEEEVVGKYNLFEDSVIMKQGFARVVRDVFDKGESAGIIIDYDFGDVDHVEVEHATHKIINSILTPVLDDDGKVSNVIVQTIDLTEITRAEEEKIKAQKHASEQEKNALVGRIAGKIAHDFNNILGVVMGNTELALIDCGDEEIRKTLKLIFDQTIRGKNLTKNLVAFAKDQEPKQEFFRIGEKMDLVTTLLKKDLEGIEIIREDRPGVPELLADPGMIEHAIVNLMQNAIHSLSKTPRPRITIRTDCRDGNIRIEIEDNGCGIPGEHIDSIYDPSFTLKGGSDIRDAYAGHIKGTGYGMANVKKYIEQHKGDISLRSEPGVGTGFTISLPVVRKDLTEEEKTEIQREKMYREKHILLVEDEAAISDVQCRVLTHPPCNHRVETANNGQAAMDLFDGNDFDLVSLDYSLPGNINGMDVYHHIRQKNNTVPILFISGNIEFLESIKELKRQDRFISHLSKPCMNKDYIKWINRLLRKTDTEDHPAGS